MARKLLFTLLAANCLFLAWSRWIAPGRPGPVPSGVRDVMTGAPPSSAPTATAGPPQVAPPCTSLGPFPDAAAQAQAATLLGAAGKSPRTRTNTLQVNDGYWVFVTDRRAGTDQQSTLAAIRRAGIDDAFVMPDDPGLRIAVGMFHERAGAEQRAARMQALQIDAVIEERTRTEPRYWVDVPGETVEGLSVSQRAQWGITTEGLFTPTCP